ncbi:MAG: adenosylmethionine decarboxylase [Chloroflexi bacterium]|nr:adenosylmethionine decarboxylase [Chloroflexota bacterium]
MNALGTHLLLDLKECNPELLNDLHFIKQAMMGAADEARATIVGESFHKFHPVGVTGVLSIAESHLLIHTWPEHGYAAFDIFTCGSVLKLKKAADLIIERLECSQPKYTELQRGLMAERAASAT